MVPHEVSCPKELPGPVAGFSGAKINPLFLALKVWGHLLSRHRLAHPDRYTEFSQPVKGLACFRRFLPVCSCARAAVTKRHRRGGFQHRSESSDSSGGWKSKSKMSTGLVFTEASPLGLQMAAFRCLLMAFLTCVRAPKCLCVQNSFFHTVTLDKVAPQQPH